MVPQVEVLFVSAFFSPAVPLVLLIISVTFASYILPSFISNLVSVLLSTISCPNEPNILVVGSIYVNVPIPLILSLT